MKLMDYWASGGKNRFERKRFLADFAKRCGTTHAYAKHIASGRKRPGVDLARAMVRESCGALTLDELLPPKQKGVK
jgi:hypothetical protein